MARFELARLHDGVRRTTHEHVRDTLREAIVLGALPPGERLVQTELAEELSVSVTPVREALRDLVNEGLVAFDPHRGATVRVVDVDEARDIWDLRLVLEPLAMRWAARSATPAQLEQAARLHDRLDAEQDHTRWLELHRSLHLVLIDACGSPRLAEILRNLRNASGPFQSAVIREHLDVSAPHAGHRSLLDALASGDEDAAARFMLDHLNPARERLGGQRP